MRRRRSSSSSCGTSTVNGRTAPSVPAASVLLGWVEAVDSMSAPDGGRLSHRWLRAYAARLISGFPFSTTGRTGLRRRNRNGCRVSGLADELARRPLLDLDPYGVLPRRQVVGQLAGERPVAHRVGRLAVERSEHRAGRIHDLKAHGPGGLTGGRRVERPLRGHLAALVDLRAAREEDHARLLLLARERGSAERAHDKRRHPHDGQNPQNTHRPLLSLTPERTLTGIYL